VKSLAALIAVAALAGARYARSEAEAARPAMGADDPYAPAPELAPIVSLEYREAADDYLFVELGGYFARGDASATGIVTLVEAMAAVDPGNYRIYDYGVRLVPLGKGADNATLVRALAVLDQGMRVFPDDFDLPQTAAQMWLFDYKATGAERRRADERGVELLESAIHKPKAPAHAATLVATLRTKLGQRQRAIDGIREMLLVTDDEAGRKALIEKLAELTHQDADEIAAEAIAERTKFLRAWEAERPALPESMYLLVGPPLGKTFDLDALGRGPAPIEDVADPE
jgi:hypothetical protein